MEVTPVLAFKVFVSATTIAGLIDMYIVRRLKHYSGSFSSETFVERNLRWANLLPAMRYIIGDETIAFMKTRTLLFPVFELVFGTLVVASMYTHGLDGNFIRCVIFLVIALALAIINWQDPSMIAPNNITHPGILIGLLTSLIPGSIGLASPAFGAVISFALHFVIAIVYPAGMGMGCVKAAMMIGAFCGFPGAFVFMLFAFILGGLVGGGLLLTGRVGRKDPIPFVPFQVVGGVTAMLWSSAMISWYLAVRPA